MKVLPFKIPKPNQDALVYQEDYEHSFYSKFHQHQEIQVSYIAEGHGTLLVGDSINEYNKGDILILGSYLPHVFKSEKSNKKSLMLSLFFTKDSFGTHFFETEELRKFNSFFKKSENGFIILSKKQQLQYYFEQLKQASKFERFILFLKIIDNLSSSKYRPLSFFAYKKQYSEIEGKRISAVIEYTINNFQNHISLEQIASVATLTKNAFCKYFKKRTNKTYIQFLTELRIEHACKLLIKNNDFSIEEIAGQSGFNNISNFNRQFKKIKNTIPSKYSI